MFWVTKLHRHCRLSPERTVQMFLPLLCQNSIIVWGFVDIRDVRNKSGCKTSLKLKPNFFLFYPQIDDHLILNSLSK